MNRAIGGELRAFLVYLSTRMNERRHVSVPQTELAGIFGVSPRTIRDRVADAHRVGFLDTVVRGKPHTTAVYQAVVPLLGARSGVKMLVRPSGQAVSPLIC